jgi:hypothetical protein
MRTNVWVLAVAIGGILASGSALGTLVEVTVTGQVVFNNDVAPPLGNVHPGDSVEMSFIVDSDNFLDGIPGDTRGYVIDEASFSLLFDGTLDVGLMPFGPTPFFTVVEGFPVSDGFFVATSPNPPQTGVGVPLELVPYNVDFSVSYTGDTLDSLDILDALGVYDSDGLTSFRFNLWVVIPGRIEMEIDFSQLTISEGAGDGGSDVPTTSLAGVLVLGLIVLLVGTAVLLRRSETTRGPRPSR